MHLFYYLLAHSLSFVSESFVALRLLSVAAMALVPVVLLMIGKELHSTPLGGLAALVFIVDPVASGFAQQTRPYGLVILATTISTLLLLRAVHQDRLGRWVKYSALIVACGLLNVLSLLIVLPHGALVLSHGGRAGGAVHWERRSGY